MKYDTKLQIIKVMNNLVNNGGRVWFCGNNISRTYIT